MEQTDIIILGAGAAGLFAAGTAAARGRRVVVIDHAETPGEKIRISGGGRCNFTNLNTTRERFLSQNPRFAASALSRFTPRDFVALVDRAGIAWHDKGQGQLFCDGRAQQIVDLLTDRLDDAGGLMWLDNSILEVRAEGGGYVVETERGPIQGQALIVATGGKSIPKIGATSLGYRLAEQFGLRLVEAHPGLVPLTFAEQDLHLAKPLSGLSLPARVSQGRTGFDDALLFTHRGLSGPAILQISSFWRPGQSIEVDLRPGTDIAAALVAAKAEGGRRAVATALAQHLPERLAHSIAEDIGLGAARLADQSNKVLAEVGLRVNRWALTPVGSEGYRTAEVTVGGVDTRDLDSRTMQARNVPGLYFIGEVVDVTGWLGGYNFQWAWASAQAAGMAA
ncbi:NAD(P)/FAD-dependent oxidoreductase [Paracoccus sp. p4-l81]|uniref:NAD(P)/FAD-dependent oxidoreductase n=1 Tax=unclassified Paracoccus (in: a-proteobacteria) TaxID=2688777 RepID=UPI0035B6B56A